MWDRVAASGIHVNTQGISEQFGVPVVCTSASKRQGIPEVRSALVELLRASLSAPVGSAAPCETAASSFPAAFHRETDLLLAWLLESKVAIARFQAQRLLIDSGEAHVHRSIPNHLAAALGERLREARARLASLEAEALRRAGVEDLEKALASAREHLAGKDAALDAARRTLALADNQRDQLISGAGDPAYIEALATIAAADAKDDLATLYAEARRTPTRADETIVGRIEAVDKQIASADSELQGLRETARSLAKRRTDVERTRERFQRSGYDHPNATFGNERMIAEVLGGILTGALKGSVLWDTLRGGYSSQPPRSRPDFGGGFPFPLPGPWNQENESGNVWGDGWRNPGSSGPWAPHSDDNNDDFSTGGRF
jgi:hypothetical protein